MAETWRTLLPIESVTEAPAGVIAITGTPSSGGAARVVLAHSGSASRCAAIARNDFGWDQRSAIKGQTSRGILPTSPARRFMTWRPRPLAAPPTALGSHREPANSDR